jgi:hypothetical protein
MEMNSQSRNSGRGRQIVIASFLPTRRLGKEALSLGGYAGTTVQKNSNNGLIGFLALPCVFGIRWRLTPRKSAA